MKFWIDPEGIQHSGECLASKNGFDAINCTECGFIHVIPLPSGKELESYYRDTFYSDYKPDYMQQHKRDLKWWTLQFEERKLLFTKTLKLNKNSNPRILDIGSGPGFFLKYFKDHGWDVLGLEPGGAAVDFSRNMGIEVVQEAIENIRKLNLGTFDVIHSNQTFEHLINPTQALFDLKDMLDNDGILFLSVANDFNPLQRIAQEYIDVPDWWFIPPEHINYWNIDSLTQLLVKSGYQIIHRTVTFPIDLFLLMGDNYIVEPSLGKAAHNRRKQLEFSLMESGNYNLKSNLYKAFMKAGIGREVEVMARPK